MNHHTGDVPVAEGRKGKVYHVVICKLGVLAPQPCVCYAECRVGQFCSCWFFGRIMLLRSREGFACISRHGHVRQDSIHARSFFFQVAFFLIEMCHFGLWRRCKKSTLVCILTPLPAFCCVFDMQETLKMHCDVASRAHWSLLVAS